jgi:protein TonB
MESDDRVEEPRPVATFASLEPKQKARTGWRRGRGALISLAVHGVLVLALIVIPVLTYGGLPAVGERVTRAFFAQPLELAPPPPPPPPPPPAARQVPIHHTPPPKVDTSRLVAPVDVPNVLPPPEESLDLGIQGGVPGGVEGGVPGGVIGGIVGGLPPAPPPPSHHRVVRVGGNIVAPALLKRVEPAYPPLARAARVQGIVILEAHVDTHGRVANVQVLRGNPLLDEAALAAVRQWRYRPLLLNGEPTEFILTVTISFHLAT